MGKSNLGKLPAEAGLGRRTRLTVGLKDLAEEFHVERGVSGEPLMVLKEGL